MANYALIYLLILFLVAVFLSVVMQSDALKIKRELKDAKIWAEVSKWLTQSNWHDFLS